MKKAIKLLENRITALKYMLSLEESEKAAGAILTLTTPNMDVRLSEAEFLLESLKKEYDKTRNKRKTNNNPNETGSKTP